MLLLHVSHTLASAPDVQAIHLLRTIRRAVEAVLAIVFVIGLLLGFVVGRAVGRRR